MNYLAHFAQDEHRLSPAFAVGGALPDLARLRGEGFRLRPGFEADTQVLTLLQAQVEAGIARHYAIDAAWHNAPAFAQMQARIRALLAEAGITLLRPSFAAHIGAEMLLDRALLQADPTLADRFYASFTPDALEAAYSLLPLKGQAVWATPLRAGIDKFLHRRFLADYAGGYLARTWPGIYTHVTGDKQAQANPEAVWMEVVERGTLALSQDSSLVTTIKQVS